MRRFNLLAALVENFRAAFGAMWGQKLRAFLTLVGIVAGVATVILMVSFVTGFNNAITAAFTSFGTHLVQFQKYEPRFGGGELPEEQRRRKDLTLEDAFALKRLCRSAGAVSPERYLFRTTVVKYGKQEANSPVVFGAASEYPQANNHFVDQGRFLNEADVNHAARVCVIGTDVADTLFPHRDPMGRELHIEGVAYQVIGVFEKKGGFLGGSANNMISIPISAFDEQFPEVRNSHGDTLHIATIPARPEDVDKLIDEGTTILRIRRKLAPNQPNDFAIFTSAGRVEQFKKVTGGVASAMIVIAGISLLVGGVGVMNIMLVNVTERTREIGIRKAVGAAERDIAIQFLVEAVFLTGFGGLIGIGFGFATALLVKATLNFPVATPLWAVVLGFAVSSAVGLVFGLWPALRAARLDPVVSLRYE